MDDDTALEYIGRAAADLVATWHLDSRHAYPEHAKNLFRYNYLEDCYQEILGKYLLPLDTPLPGM